MYVSDRTQAVQTGRVDGFGVPSQTKVVQYAVLFRKYAVVGSLCASICNMAHDSLKTYVCVLYCSPCAPLRWPHG